MEVKSIICSNGSDNHYHLMMGIMSMIIILKIAMMISPAIVVVKMIMTKRQKVHGSS